MPATRSWTRWQAAGLIAYDTVRNLEAAGRQRVPIRLLRPRVILYATAMADCRAGHAYALLLRPDLEVNVLHDRNPLYVQLSDGGLRNGYTVKLLNRLYMPRSFSIGVAGLPGATLSVIGHDQESRPVVTVPPDQLQSLRLYVTLDKSAVAGPPRAATEFSFVITDIADQIIGTARKRRSKGPTMSRKRWFAEGLEGRHVLMALIAFFGVMLIANGIFVYFAVLTFSGGDTPESYRKGLNYNETIAAGASDRARLAYRARL